MAAGHVDVEFVPGPGLFVALAVFLAADVAGGGQVGEHLAEVLRDLPLETRRLRLRPRFVLARTSALARRRGMIGSDGVFAVVGLHLNRLLARFDLGGVARDRPDDASPERPLDQRRVDPCPAARPARIRRTPGKTWPRTELARVAPSRRMRRRGTCRRRRRSIRALVVGTPRDRLGHESSGEGATVLGRPAPVPWAARERRLRGRSRRAW